MERKSKRGDATSQNHPERNPRFGCFDEVLEEMRTLKARTREATRSRLWGAMISTGVLVLYGLSGMTSAFASEGK